MTGLKIIAPESIGGGAPATPRLPIPDAGLAAGVLKFSEKLGEVADHEQNLSRISTLADASSTYQTALDRKRLELSTDPDVAGREGKFQQFAQAEFGKLHGAMDGTTGALFKRAANPLADSMSTSVRHGAQKDQLENALVGLRDTNDKLVTASGDAPNPNARQAILDQIDESLKLARESQVLSPAQYEQEKKATLVKADQALALKLIRTDSSGTAKALEKSDFLPNLDPVNRQRLIDQAGSEVLRRANLAYTQTARADIVERRQMAKTSDEAMKQIIDLNDKNELTDEELTARRPFLNHTEYQTGKLLLRGGTNIDNMDAVARLEPQIGDRDMKKELGDALLSRQITKQTYSSLMNRNETLLKDDQPESPYKRGREQVAKALTPGALLSGPAADIQKQALVGALREYDDFAQGTGPDKLRAAPDVTLGRAQDIVNRYRLVNYDKIGEAIGMPRFIDKPRDLIAEPDLQAAGKRVLEEFDGGRMTRAERDQQLLKIEQWESILKDRTAAQAAQTQKSGALPPKKVP